MEVITIENRAFQELLLKLDQLHEYFVSVPKIQDVPEVKEIKETKDIWLDSKAVCERLNISNRTLYRMRKERSIVYSTLRGRCRFKESDVDKILNKGVVVSNPETMDELRQPYQNSSYGKF